MAIPQKKDTIAAIKKFFQTDLWHFPSYTNGKKESFFKTVLRIVTVASQEFVTNKCSLAAASLTFYTMMSIVPILSVAFAIAKGFGLKGHLESVISKQLQAYPDIAAKLIVYAEKMLDNTNAAGLAGIGVLLLLFSVLKLFSNIEGAFNEVWGVKSGRKMIRKVADYLAFTFFFVIIILITTSLPNFVTSFLPGICDNLNLGEWTKQVITESVQISSYVFSGLIFILIYIFVPNTKVRISSAVLPGIVAGSAFQALQWMIAGQFVFFKENPIYGSLAAFPVLLVALQLSWLILLFGAELSYAAQNLKNYAYSPECSKLSRRFRTTIIFMVLHDIATAFKNGKPPKTDFELCTGLNLPVRLLRDILHHLENAKLIVAVRTESGEESAWQPATDTSRLTPAYIIGALDRAGIESLELFTQPATEKMKRHFQKLAESVSALPSDKPITEIS